MTFLYFAYGSNMLAERLSDPSRCPSAKPVGTAIAHGHLLTFGKKSVDNSGKANLVACDGERTPGALFEIALEDLQKLDGAEGVNPKKPESYRRNEKFEVRIAGTGTVAVATAYVADEVVGDLKPYDWYLALVVAGAMERQLCPDYIQALSEHPYIIDKKFKRKSRLQALCNLKAAGYEKYNELLLAHN